MTTIDLDAMDPSMTVSRHVPGRGRVDVHPLAIGSELDLWTLDETWRGVGVRAFVDATLVEALREELSPAEVRGLSAVTRARLRVAAAQAMGLGSQYRHLAGSPLTGDERLYAVMRWRQQRLARELGETCASAADGLMKSIRPRHLQAVGTPVKVTGPTPIPVAVKFPTVRVQVPPMRVNVSPMLLQLRLPNPVDVANGVLKRVVEENLPGRMLSQVASNIARAQLRMPRLRDLPEWQAIFAPAEKFRRSWESSAHWFLLRWITVRQARELSERPREEVIGQLIEAVELAVNDTTFTATVQEAVQTAPVLSPSSRRHLVHGLAHAQKGEYVDACPPLMQGVEGAFWAVAYEHGVINAQRFFAHQPTKLAGAVEMLFNHLPLPQALKTLLRRQVFGTTGNPFRHGDNDGDERRQVLMAVVALIGWLDVFADASLRSQLGKRLQAALPEAA